MPEIDDLVQGRAQQVLLSLVARLAHRSSPEAENTAFRESCRARSRESQIARKSRPSPGFPAKANTSPTPISQKCQNLPGPLKRGLLRPCSLSLQKAATAFRRCSS
jgi:hypothetical protein